VYFFDTTAAVAHFKMSSPKQSCCKKMMAKYQAPGRCPAKKKDCTRDCFNCPLAYLATMAATISITPVSNPFHHTFSSFTENFSGDYQYKAWKPPDNDNLS
jgi:hypothetical protein